MEGALTAQIREECLFSHDVTTNEHCSYNRSTIWVKYEPRKQRFSKSTTDATIEPRRQNQLSVFRSEEPTEASNQYAPAVALSIGLIQTQLELQILDQFLNVYIPKIPVSGVILPWTMGWRDTIAHMSGCDSLIKLTMASLGLSCLGDRLSDESLRTQGVELYGVALSQLNERLKHTKDAAIDEHVVTAILLMGDYEQFNGFSVASHPGQSRSWQSHIIGVGQLFESQGPFAFANQSAFLVFQFCQQVLFISACISRRETFLASTQWRTVPWKGRRKDWRDRLFDVVFPLPGLVEEADKALAYGSIADAAYFTKPLLAMSTALDLWKVSVENECHTALGELLSTIDNSNGSGIGELKASAFDPLELQTAMLFCAVKIHVLILILDLLALEPLNKKASTDYQLQAAISYALWLLHAIPVAVRDGGIIGSQSVLFPLGTIRWLNKHLALSHPEIAGSLLGLMTEATRGMDYMRFLGNFLGSIPTN